jgi:hypothetical protein
MRNTGLIKRPRIGRSIIGRGHHCKICSRPMRSGAPIVCADCKDKGYTDDVIAELEKDLRKKVKDEVDSWRQKLS